MASQKHIHNVVFKDGTPTLSEFDYYDLAQKNITEDQIKFALDSLAREVIKKAVCPQSRLESELMAAIG